MGNDANPQVNSQPTNPLTPQSQEVRPSPQSAITPSSENVSPRKNIFKQFIMSGKFRLIATAVGMVVFLILLTTFIVGSFKTAGGRVELTWWGVEHDPRIYEGLIQKYQTKNPNITIKYEKQSKTDYRDRLSAALVSGKGPDIFEIHNSWPSMLKSVLSKVPTSVMSADDYKRDFYPIMTTNFTLGNGIVAVPLEYDALTLFINDEIFAAGAKEPPDSWDELKLLAESLTQKDGRGQISQAGVALGITQNVDYWPDIFGLMLLQNKVNPLKPTGSFAQDVFVFYKLFNKRTWDDTMPPSTEAFAKGKLAMYFAPTREALNIVKINPNLRFRTVNLPQLAKNSPTDADYTYATYWAQSVSNKSKNQTEAWKFLVFLAQEESLNEINQQIKTYETFARIFPRPSMNTVNLEDGMLGSVIRIAPTSVSSLLADKTGDGVNGINTKVNDAYKKTIDSWSGKGEAAHVDLLLGNINQILSSFGIVVK